MKYNISKELFEEVMKVELAGFSINQQNIIEYIVNKVGYFEVPIDTFFFKCKEWALSQGYTLASLITKDGGGCTILELWANSTEADTEQQAVFNATEKLRQWILEKENEREEIIYARMENYAKNGKEALLDFDELMKNRDASKKENV